MCAFKSGEYPFDAMQKVANEKVGLIDPVNLKQRQALEADFSLKREERYLGTCVTDLEVKGFTGAQEALEVAVEAIYDARRRIKKESETE